MYQIWQLIDGFLNLLNNDYYLDLKTESINKYLEETIDTHVGDTSIHFSWSDVINLLGDNVGLSKHAIFRLPIYTFDKKYSVTYLKQLIEKCPKNLNKYVALFEFCIPVSEVIGKCVADTNSTTTPTPVIQITADNYKEFLKLSADDVNASNKFAPNDTFYTYSSIKDATNNTNNPESPVTLELDLGDTSFSFDNFLFSFNSLL